MQLLEQTEIKKATFWRYIYLRIWFFFQKGGIYSDTAIERRMELGDIKIFPFYKQCLGSNSYDLHLGQYALMYENTQLDPKNPPVTQEIHIPKEGYLLKKGQFLLMNTLEYTETYKCVPFIDGKSSAGRLAIVIHFTAGKGDAGFKGQWTLEVEACIDIMLYPGMPLGQIYYYSLVGKVKNRYDKKINAKYNGQTKPVPSMMHKNYEVDPLWGTDPATWNWKNTL